MNSPVKEIPDVLKTQCGFQCLTDISHSSFNEFHHQVSEHLSWSEAHDLYHDAQQAQKDNRLYEARILKRANPQLQNAVHLAIIAPTAELIGYNNQFSGRASQYVAPGTVSSMFSPAAYLTELYREARNLHADGSIYHLDTRRPDLKSMALSQQNMDIELSTLSLSNELLLESIKTESNLDNYAKVMEMLSTFRPSGATPYHDAYENVRKVIQLQDPGLEQLNASPAIAGLMHQASLLGINASISPELFNILTEEITEGNAEELYKKNFGNIEPASLAMPEYLKRYYNLSDEELSQFIGKASNFGQQEYSNNQFITPVVNSSDGTVKVYRITREYTTNAYQVDVELFPYGGENYQLNYKFKDFWNASYLSIKLNDKRELVRTEGAPQVNIEYSEHITLSTTDIGQPFEIGLTRVLPSGSWAYAAAKFTVEEYNQYSFLLKLNKAIRLSRATELSPTILESIVRSVNQQLDINAEVLGKVFLTKYYIQRYAINAETALILCNALISQRSYDNQPSQFDRLFNTPLLNGQYFSTEDEEIDLNPGSTGDWRKAVLKRAFNIDDVSLYRLLKITNHNNQDGKIKNNLDNLSDLYIGKLLAEIHQLTIDELDLLLVAVGEGKTNLSAISDKQLAALIRKLNTITGWLQTQKWSVFQLFVMTSTSYNKTLTPEIKNLLDTVYHGLQGFDKDKADLLHVMAPYIAATLQLSSENVAHSVLLWADKLQPGDGAMTAEKFWDWLNTQYTPDSSEVLATQEHIVQYCQALAQLEMVYHSTGINENAFRLFVTKPEMFGSSTEAIPAHDALSLIMLTRFADWVNALGEKASSVLAAFEAKTLTAEQLAGAMNLDANLLLQASTQAQNHQHLPPVTQENAFSCWTSIDTILQWINVAQQLNVAPQGVSALVGLDYIQSNQKIPTYAKWENAAGVLTAGLNSQQADTLHAFLDESRSAALSTYYIRQVAKPAAAIKSRDDLYQYLLIDNQVSAAIKTTRIAEGIASIQLYVNRTLENVEENAHSGVISRQFFIDWDKYNKRYSTWAGVSQLVYYPENYIDPTMRIGQTKMMDALLQSVSQSQLNADTVEDAFMSYLTSFEQVANLKVISAYHDNINNDQGLTYFIGLSETDTGEYYWRSVDHSKFSDGKFAANAWSEWHKIDCPINPYRSTIRPVMYKSRLYLLWLEQKEITKQTGNSKDGYQTETDYRYELKLAHIRYDGTWNTPITFDVNEKISKLELAKNKAPGLYCAGYQGEDTLLVMFYNQQDTLDSYKTAAMQGLYIFADMEYKDMTPEQSNVYRDNSYQQFDTNSVRRVNNRYAENYEIPSSVNSNNGYGRGEYNISMVHGGDIPIIRYQASSSDLKIHISPKLRITHEGADERTRNQCSLIKKYGKLGDKFVVYTDLGINPDHSPKKQLFYPIYQYSGNTSSLDKGRLLFHRDTNYSSKVEAWIRDAGRSLIKDNAAIGDDYITDSLNKPDDLKKYIFMIDHMGIATDVSGPVDINTAISPAKVQVTVKAGSKEQTFTADKDVSIQPSPSFDKMNYQFNALEIDGSSLNFNNNSASIDITFTAFAENGRKLGYESFSIPVTRKVNTDNALTLHHNENGAQYMQWQAYRTRLNTLFARQLVARATTGIDTILSMETQNIQEPVLWSDNFTATLPIYDSNLHGSSKNITIMLGNSEKQPDQENVIYQGELTDKNQLINLSETYISVKNGSNNTKPVDNKGNDSWIYLFVKYSANSIKIGEFWFKNGKNFQGYYPKGNEKNRDPIFIENKKTEPMDFSGANSLYFWELFYYTPMLVAQRLLHEQNFDEANRWLKYVWSPSGYIVHGQIQNYQWNVRPLLEDTSWNSDPLDSVDPDAVAQHDPMHYKVSTFMRTLDLLIARGDHAYRQLERDTLNEAKMWYMQALHLLGDKPYLPQSTTWNDPRLDKAADITTQSAHASSIVALRQSTPTPLLLRSANTLTDLFLPQINEVMMNYWQTLAQRVYNLRHNLSIDGQPLYLPIYATPADPKALLSAAVATSQGGGKLLESFMSLWRFPHMLENARSMVSQLTQFGSTLQNIIERQDAEALNALLQNQAAELILTNLSIQDKTIEELDAEKTVLEKSKAGAQSRFDGYSKLYDENINAGENQAMTLRASAAGLTTAVQASRLAGAAADLVPNIFGFAGGGSRWGAIAEATGYVMEFSANVMNTEADKISQSETYRRRRQEWEIQRNNAEAELKQIDAQLKSLAVRREAAVLQKTSLKTQQEQTQAQLAFLQRKFSNQALYNWLRGRLAAIYFQFYDLAVARCLMAEQAYRWEINDDAARFIKPGAWQGTYAGLLAGETLMLSLAQMEDAHLKRDKRALEVERTVSLAEVYAGLPQDKGSFSLSQEIEKLVNEGSGSAGNGNNNVAFGAGTDTKTSLQASISLADLKIREDYPESIGKIRRIKQISVTLPALLGPYQDVQAILSYGDKAGLANGCEALAVSHGMNDSGQFQLDFNDGKFLPFEGIAIDQGTLTLSFPNASMPAKGKQATMLKTLNDIILHIRYTIK
ncbi:neuraminidase-like domain-containing protein [Photorhabdus sp. APURE]|uniref:Tc toxin subunit A-related protein n=1 Tax=Photorhabdus aballayi TaxID=2991723 RepID=UPI00223D2121|nr:neuraminidase-like domain-containing protein [Photorhabdus aballayi]MCW7546988.1 neuraminidase-like domain-containing protein [Photorhabdus aballayi]